MITSVNNSQIKHLIQLQNKGKLRDEEKVFICEGRKMFDELREQRPEMLIRAYVSQSFYSQMDTEQPGYFDTIDYEVVQDSVFREAAQTVTPQGVLAVVRQPQYELQELFTNGPLRLLFLENLNDPGNLGTILRTAEGAGMDGVILTKGSVDIFNPKVIRSTMGSVFRVPFVYTDVPQETLQRMKKKEITRYAAYLKGSQDYDTVAYAERSVILIGNEANGLSDMAAELSDICIRIPMAGKVESLNAAVAAALIMYRTRK